LHVSRHCVNFNKSSPKSFGKSASLPLTAETALDSPASFIIPKRHSKQWTRKPPKPSVRLQDVDPHLTYQCLGRPHSPPQTASTSNQPFYHNSPTGETNSLRQVIWHDASRSQWQEYALEIGEILHIFPLAPKEWETGDPKRLTRVRPSEDRYIPADQIWL